MIIFQGHKNILWDNHILVLNKFSWNVIIYELLHSHIPLVNHRKLACNTGRERHNQERQNCCLMGICRWVGECFVTKQELYQLLSKYEFQNDVVGFIFFLHNLKANKKWKNMLYMILWNKEVMVLSLKIDRGCQSSALQLLSSVT